MNRTQYFALLRKIRIQHLADVKYISIDHEFVDYCENVHGFRPILGMGGYTAEYKVINEAKFNWTLLKIGI
jgi:hypothetical protein